MRSCYWPKDNERDEYTGTFWASPVHVFLITNREEPWFPEQLFTIPMFFPVKTRAQMAALREIDKERYTYEAIGFARPSEWEEVFKKIKRVVAPYPHVPCYTAAGEMFSPLKKDGSLDLHRAIGNCFHKVFRELEKDVAKRRNKK